MALIELVSQSISNYLLLLSFLAGLIAGEETVILVSLLATQNGISLWLVWILASLGFIVADLFFFIIGRLKIFKRLGNYFKTKANTDQLNEIIEKYQNKSLFLFLIIIKSVYGLGITGFIYLGARRKVSFKKLLPYEILVTLSLVSIFVFVGFLAGRGYTVAKQFFEGIYFVISFVFLLILIFYFVQRWVKRKFFKNRF